MPRGFANWGVRVGFVQGGVCSGACSVTRGKGGEAPRMWGHSYLDTSQTFVGLFGAGLVEVKWGAEGGKRQPCPAVGKSTLAIVTFAKYEWFEEWKDEPVNKRGDAYEDLKKTFVDAVMEVVFKLYPNIEDKVRKSGVHGSSASSPESLLGPGWHQPAQLPPDYTWCRGAGCCPPGPRSAQTWPRTPPRGCREPRPSPSPMSGGTRPPLPSRLPLSPADRVHLWGVAPHQPALHRQPPGGDLRHRPRHRPHASRSHSHHAATDGCPQPLPDRYHSPVLGRGRPQGIGVGGQKSSVPPVARRDEPPLCRGVLQELLARTKAHCRHVAPRAGGKGRVFPSSGTWTPCPVLVCYCWVG